MTEPRSDTPPPSTLHALQVFGLMRHGPSVARALGEFRDGMGLYAGLFPDDLRSHKRAIAYHAAMFVWCFYMAAEVENSIGSKVILYKVWHAIQQALDDCDIPSDLPNPSLG